MYLVACGVIGLGDWIWLVDKGRPLGISTVRLSRRELCFECLEEEDLCLDEEECLLDFPVGTSRMFKMRPVVGSVV